MSVQDYHIYAESSQLLTGSAQLNLDVVQIFRHEKRVDDVVLVEDDLRLGCAPLERGVDGGAVVFTSADRGHLARSAPKRKCSQSGQRQELREHGRGESGEHWKSNRDGEVARPSFHAFPAILCRRGGS